MESVGRSVCQPLVRRFRDNVFETHTTHDASHEKNLSLKIVVHLTAHVAFHVLLLLNGRSWTVSQPLGQNRIVSATCKSCSSISGRSDECMNPLD